MLSLRQQHVPGWPLDDRIDRPARRHRWTFRGPPAALRRCRTSRPPERKVPTTQDPAEPAVAPSSAFPTRRLILRRVDAVPGPDEQHPGPGRHPCPGPPGRTAAGGRSPGGQPPGMRVVGGAAGAEMSLGTLTGGTGGSGCGCAVATSGSPAVTERGACVSTGGAGRSGTWGACSVRSVGTSGVGAGGAGGTAGAGVAAGGVPGRGAGGGWCRGRRGRGLVDGGGTDTVRP